VCVCVWYVQVLYRYTEEFDFSGKTFDMAVCTH